MNNMTVNRRRVLQGIAVGTVGGLTTGTVAARDLKRRVVGTSSQDAVGAVKRAAAEVIRVIDFDEFGHAVVGRFTDDALRTLRGRDDVRYVEAEVEMRPVPPVDITFLGELDGSQILPWGVDRVDAEVAHEAGYTGEGTHVAVIDTGIESTHRDLRANLGIGEAVADNACQWDNCNEPWDDDYAIVSHGTHVAGIAGAVDNDEGVVGVAPDATLHAVKVFEQQGSTPSSETAAGINWVTDNLVGQGNVVINMSLGGDAPSLSVKQAVARAYQEGVLIVASAGNDGPCDDCASRHWPAAYREVVSVGATAQDDSLVSFSSTGDAVELAAPGVRNHSTYRDGYAILSGTSMASPHAAAAGGLVMAAMDLPNATNIEFDTVTDDLDGDGEDETYDVLTPDSYQKPGGVREVLRDSAEDFDPAGKDRKFGYGLLDVAAALGLDSSDDLS